MAEQNEYIPDGKTDKPTQNQAFNMPQSFPEAGQRSDINGNIGKGLASGQLAEQRPGIVSFQKLRPLRTEPLSPEQGAQLLHAAQEDQSMRNIGQSTKPSFTLPQKPHLVAKPSTTSDQPSTVLPLVTGLQPAPAPANQAGLHVEEVSFQKTRPGKQEARPWPGTLSKTPSGGYPLDVSQGESAPQAPPWNMPNMPPLSPDFSSLSAENLHAGGSMKPSSQSTTQNGWEQRIAKLQTWKLLAPLQAILLFAPITWTWLSIGLASFAYSQSLQRHPELGGTSFLEMWAGGFPALKESDLFWGIWHLPLIMDVGVTIFLLAVLAFFTWVANYPVQAEPNVTQTREEITLQALNGAVIEFTRYSGRAKGTCGHH